MIPQALKAKLVSEKLTDRILWTLLSFLVVFTLVTVVSYYLLPEGILRSRNPAQKWETSPRLLFSTLQILSYNLMSVGFILLGNLFASRKNPSEVYFPLGYSVFFVLIIINAITLGTWSFAVESPAVPLLERLLGMTIIFQRGGLWEIMGQLLILCGTAKFALVLIDGKTTQTRHWTTLQINTTEIVVVVLGLVLMLIGAFVESQSIIQVQGGV